MTTFVKPDLDAIVTTGDILQYADCVYDSEAIDRALDQQAQRLNRRLQGSQPLVLCVMHGGLVYTARLIQRLDCLLDLDYLHATRYRNRTEGRDLKWLAYPSSPLQGRTVLVLDDILDEGHTLAAIVDYCKEQGAAHVLSAVLLMKEHERRIESMAQPTIEVDHALTVTDRYVFGCGMDYEGKFRQLDSIYALKG